MKLDKKYKKIRSGHQTWKNITGKKLKISKIKIDN
jgi:hypothetical protein